MLRVLRTRSQLARRCAARVATSSLLRRHTATTTTLPPLQRDRSHVLACHAAATSEPVARSNALTCVAAGADVKAAAGTGDTAVSAWVVKDNFCTRDMPTTAASAALASFAPGYDASAVARARASGAVVIAKANMDEFGMGSSNEHSVHGPVRHPLDPQRVAGGSSGGCAAAVALGACDASLGSDTGGSVRLPASYCGVVGLKPSYGAVSRAGLIAYASSLDTPAVLAKTVADAAAALDMVAGPDPQRDATCWTAPWRACAPHAALGSTAGVRVGVPASLDGVTLAPSVRDAWDSAVASLYDSGCRVTMVPALAPVLETLAAYYVIACAEASSNLARFDGIRFGSRSRDDLDGSAGIAETRGAVFGPEVLRRILAGTFVLSRDAYHVYYQRAQLVRGKANDMLAASMHGVDVLLLPTAADTAPQLASVHEHEAADGDDEGQRAREMYASDALTVPASLAGAPAVSVPYAGDDDGMPIGLQLIARPGHDAKVVQAAALLESIRGW